MLILFSFWITFATLVKTAMVIVGAGFALFLFVLIVFAVLVSMPAAIIDNVRARS